jgi:hypothetical protein
LARFLPALLVVALLGGSAAAFAVTERLKLERSPILDTRVDKQVSPAGEPADISFRLRKGDRLSVAIVDSEGSVVRSLVSSDRVSRGRQELAWDGRDDGGRIVDDGSYKPRVHLAGAHRTILLPNPILVDSAKPKISYRGQSLRLFSPDGDYRFDYLTVRFRANEPVRAVLYANGHLVVKAKKFQASGALPWNGRADGLPRPSGRYRLRLRGIDRAGNLGKPSGVFNVRIRYIELGRHLLRVRPGGRIVVYVSTDAHRYTWQIGARHGRVRNRRLVLAAGPPGRYALVVSARGHSDRARVVVRP